MESAQAFVGYDVESSTPYTLFAAADEPTDLEDVTFDYISYIPFIMDAEKDITDEYDVLSDKK